MEWTRDRFILTNEAPGNSVDITYSLLQTTYWSENRPRATVEKIIDHSLCFYLLHDGRQVGFARVITDYVTTSWIADVIVEESLRGQGLGKWMMHCLLAHPDVSDTQFALQTGSAHTFYEKLGFSQNTALMSTSVSYL